MPPPLSKPVAYLLLLTLVLTGWAGSLSCSIEHFCLCGHLTHPPYPTATYIQEGGWVAVLIAVPILAWHLRLLGRWWWLTSVVLVLPIVRLGMGAHGGFGAGWFMQYLGLV